MSSWEHDIIPPYELFNEFDCNIAIRLWFVASTITSRKDCITVTVHSFWSNIFGRELCGLFCPILAIPANPLLNTQTKKNINIQKAGLQITVGHRTLADQNLLMSDEIPNVVGHDVRTNILS